MIAIRSMQENPSRSERLHMVEHPEPCERRKYLERLLTTAILATVVILLIRFLWRQLTLSF